MLRGVDAAKMHGVHGRRLERMSGGAVGAEKLEKIPAKLRIQRTNPRNGVISVLSRLDLFGLLDEGDALLGDFVPADVVENYP
jgi:hypothetical protein